MRHWRVEVSTNGESILAIEPEMLAGKSDLTEDDHEAILTAARHLLGFLGHYLPDDVARHPVAPDKGDV